MVQTRRGTKQNSAKKPPASPAANRAIASQRVKNKVGSPVAKKKAPILPPPASPSEADYSTDEFDLDEEEDEEQPAPASDSSAASSVASNSKREKLARNVLIQLAVDINDRGGIIQFSLAEEFALANLCDLRPELYGERGSRTRLRIGKKVDRWKGKVKQNHLAWLKILEDLQVTQKPKAAPKKKGKAQEEEKDKQSEQDSKKTKTDKEVDTFHSVSSPGIPSTVSHTSVPNETMADNESVEAHFPTANVDPDLHVPEGAELSKCLCHDLSSESSHCTAF